MEKKNKSLEVRHKLARNEFLRRKVRGRFVIVDVLKILWRGLSTFSRGNREVSASVKV